MEDGFLFFGVSGLLKTLGAVGPGAMWSCGSGYTLQVRHKGLHTKLHRAFRCYPAAIGQWYCYCAGLNSGVAINYLAFEKP